MAYVNEWDGDDLWNILTLPNSELYKLYAEYYPGNRRDRNCTLRRIANKQRAKYKLGKIKMPERSEDYVPEKEPERIEARRRRASKNIGGTALDTTVITVPLEHLTYHEKLQEALNADGAVTKARFSDYEMGYKDSDGEAQTHPLHAYRFEVAFDTEPKWIPVNRVESVKLPRREKKESDALRKGKKAVILSDLQIPFESPEAVDVALQIVRDVEPDKIVLVGDMLDLTSFSRFIQRPEFAQMTQEAINRAHALLATLRKMSPTAEISVLEGNHSARLEKHVLNNAQAAFGLKRADKPDGWPVLSVPFLCAFDQLDVKWLAGYPANREWINENLQIRHGHIARKGNTAIHVAQEERTSTIFGHTHRLESQFLTHHHFNGGKTIGAWSIGCLCKIMGEVPSTKSGYDLSGNPVPNAENWQNGIAVVDYEEGDGGFNVQPLYINAFDNWKTVFNGKTYEAKKA